jgi:Ser/Thr protein kinase RdoA (MazF antagonist)
MDSVKIFLEGFDSVIPLSGKALTHIPAFTLFGAFRWETFRIQRIEMQDPERYAMRSPLEFQTPRHAWQTLQEQFDEVSSVQELS